jgi:quercetin dioxygenase-like cupin family protein
MKNLSKFVPHVRASLHTVWSLPIKLLQSSIVVGLCSIAASGLNSAAAVTTIPISLGQLPGGENIRIVQLIFGPGDSVPWHFHTGHGWVTVVSGTVTEEEGCGTEPIDHPAGSAFAEVPGHVHRVLNLSSAPAMLTFVVIYPSCDAPTIVVSGPNCEGDSGRSHLEPIPDCP